MRTKPAKNNGSLPLFPPVSTWKAPDLSSLPSWEGQDLVSIDTEFKDPTLRKLGCGARRGAYVAGYSFAFKDGFSAYVPLRHPEGSVDCEQGFRYLRDNAATFTGELLGAQTTIDVDMLHYEQTGPVDFPKIKALSDILVLQPLIYELDRGYSMEAVSERHGLEGKKEDLLKEAAACYGADTSKDTWKAIVPDLPACYVGPYGEVDALLPIPIYLKQLKIIKEKGLEEIWDNERQVTPILLKMRQRGVRIDFDHLDVVEKWAREEEVKALQVVHFLSGHRINPGDTMKVNACVPAFTAVGVQVPLKRDEKTKKLKYSLDAAFLLKISEPDIKEFDKKPKHAQVADSFLHARKMGKLYGTFCKQVRDFSTNGRLHTTFRQIIGANERNEKSGAAFGRLSSAKPNLQQQPARAKHANFFRKIYLPEEGTRWGCLDFSQQEPRWTTHIAALLGLKGAREAAKAYWDDPLLDNHDFMAKLTGLPRSHAKNIFLGLCYGEGGAKLCGELGLPTRWCVRYRETGELKYYDTKGQAIKARKEYEGEASFYEVAGQAGQEILDKFNERAPYIKQLAKLAETKARKTGQVKVVGGRVINFPMGNNGQFDWSYKALNRIIQGSAGMQVKLALIQIFKEMPNTFIQLQVHDELDGSFTSIEEMKQVAKIMRDVVKCEVPFRIDIEEGPNWGTLTQVCGNDDCTRHTCGEKNEEFSQYKKEARKFYCPEHIREAA